MSETLHPNATRLPMEKMLSAIHVNDVHVAEDILTSVNTRHPYFLGAKLLCAVCTYMTEDNALLMADRLLKYGCDVNEINRTPIKDTPLHIAAKKDYAMVVELLVSRGARRDALDIQGQTALHGAASGNAIGAVRTLIQHGSAVDHRDHYERTPLFMAVSVGGHESAQLLIQAGANVNVVDDGMLTPLDKSLLRHDIGMVKLLLKGGCQLRHARGYIYKTSYSYSVAHSVGCLGDVDAFNLAIACGGMCLKAQTMPPPPEIQKVLDEILSHPMSLTGLCRIHIRDILNAMRMNKQCALEVCIDRLPLPTKLNDFLAFR